MQKSQRQVLSLNRVINPYNKLSFYGQIHHPTGMGKTIVGALCIHQYIQKYGKDKKIIVIYPYVGLDENWKNSIEKVRVIPEFSDYVINDEINVEYITASKAVLDNKIIHCDLLIVDEVHDFNSDKRLLLINGDLIRRKHIIGFTATPDYSMDKILPILDVISEQEAIENDWISNYIEFNLGIYMNEEESNQYDKITTSISRQNEIFGKNTLEVAQACLNGGEDSKGKFYPADKWCLMVAMKNGWHENLNLIDPSHAQINSIYSPGMIKGYAGIYMKNIKERKDLMYNNHSKMFVALQIIKKFESLKTIVFGESVKFADELNKAINNYYKDTTEFNINGKPIYAAFGNYEISQAYHSSLETRLLPSPKTGKPIKFGCNRLKEMIIDGFKNSTIRIICSARGLDTGFDAEDVRLAIITSRSQSAKQRTQRGGRAKRKEFGNSTKAIIVNIYFKGTVDETWLKNSQLNNDENVYFIDSIDEITYNPKKKRKISISL